MYMLTKFWFFFTHSSGPAFELSTALFWLVLLTFSVVTIYVLWRWCQEERNKSSTKENEKMVMKPVYAHEIEPGIVILQSEDGEYFKILKEYNPKTDQTYGSLFTGQPLMTSRIPNTSSAMTSSETSALTPSPSAPSPHWAFQWGCWKLTQCRVTWYLLCT